MVQSGLYLKARAHLLTQERGLDHSRAPGGRRAGLSVTSSEGFPLETDQQVGWTARRQESLVVHPNAIGRATVGSSAGGRDRRAKRYELGAARHVIEVDPSWARRTLGAPPAAPAQWPWLCLECLTLHTLQDDEAHLLTRRCPTSLP